jgi:hypothetical protein
MQSYYTSGSNLITIRVEETNTGSLTLHYQDMITLQNYTQSISQFTYTDYESVLAFTASLVSASIGDEYRAYIVDGVDEVVWNGTIQVFASASQDKSVYVNQNTSQYISNVSENNYIILN